MQKTECGCKVNYLRVSVTDLCNLRCLYCMGKEGVVKKTHQEILSLEQMASFIQAAVGWGVDKLRITGGEPLIRKNLPWLIREISSDPKLRDIAMTTNGIYLKQYAESLKSAGLNRVNISLDTLDAQKFSEITRGGHLQDVLDGIRAAFDAGLRPIKINTVLQGGVNDDEVEALANLSTNGMIDEVRFIELMPIGQAATWSKERFVSNDLLREKLRLIPEKQYAPSSPAQMYSLPGGGKVGLINPVSHRFCADCNRLRLTADGKLKPCLLTDVEIDVRSVFFAESPHLIRREIEKALDAAASSKGIGNHLDDKSRPPVNRDMFRVGG